MKTFNEEKKFRTLEGVGPTSHKRLIDLQPVKSFEVLIKELVNLKGLGPKSLISIFKNLASKLNNNFMISLKLGEKSRAVRNEENREGIENFE